MSDFRLTLLGAFTLSGSAPCAMPSKKGQALLAFLAIPPGQTHRRDKLATMLWSGHSEESARQNLRQCLTAIRRGCQGNGALPVVAEGDLLRLDPAHVTVDVSEFEQVVRGREPAALARAFELYRGQLLDGLNLQEGPFEEWLIGERRRLNALATEGLGQLLQHQQQSGMPKEAMQTALRLLSIDPLQEDVHRSLMRLYHDGGNTAQALRQYELCEKALRRELAVDPEGKTKELRRDILRSRHISRPSKTESDMELALDALDRLASPPSGPEILRPLDSHTPDRPRLSVVVLPFANVGGDKELHDFVEAITVNLTTDLSRLPDYFVIACKTAFAYRGQAVDARQIGRELGVRYVVEGSVQSGADSLRVNAQLIDAESGAHLWAERFDKPRAEPFNMQDEITARLARAMDVQLIAIETRRVKQERPSNLDAIDLALRGWTVFFQNPSVRSAREARRIFEDALRIDDKYVDPLIGLVETHMWEVNSYMSNARAEQVRLAEAAMAKVLELAPNSTRAHFSRAWVLMALRQPSQAYREIELAIGLDPNLAYLHMRSAWIKIFLGRAKEAEGDVARAMRLSPRDPLLGNWYAILGLADLHLGRLDKAVDRLRKAVEIAPNHEIAYFYLAAALALQGRETEAAQACMVGRRLAPNFRIGKCRAEVQSDNPVFLAQRERLYEGLEKAGLPE